MVNDIYFKLGERLNQFEGKHALVDSFLALLKEIYAEEEAELAVNFPSGSFAADVLALLVKKDQTELMNLLDTMANKGTVVTYGSEGQRKYELAPFYPGAIEFNLVNDIHEPETIMKMAYLLAMVGEETKVLIDKLMVDAPEKAIELVTPNPALRTMTIDVALPVERDFPSYDSIVKRIENETSIAAMKCTCRSLSAHAGNRCQVQGIPEHSCLFFGKAADYIIERKIGNAQRINLQECKELLETCNKAGLVQNTNNFSNELRLICNCCKCCCGPLTTARAIGPAMVFNTANFAPSVDTENCTGCGECVDQCSVNAIHLKDDLACVDRSACLGCGNCVTVCPVESISMIRVTAKKAEAEQ